MSPATCPAAVSSAAHVSSSGIIFFAALSIN
jgi:hypothetical protein